MCVYLVGVLAELLECSPNHPSPLSSFPTTHWLVNQSSMLLPGPLPPGLSHAAAAATSSPHSTELTGGKGFQPDTSVAANKLSQYTCSIIPPPIILGIG